MRFMAICGSGLGSSFMVEMNIQQILNEMEVSGVEVSHSDISSVGDNDANVFFLAKDVAENVSLDKSKVVVLDSIIDKEELRVKVEEVIKKYNLD